MGNNGEEVGSSDSFEDMLGEDDRYLEPKRGDIRPAIILQVTRNEIIVDLGVKRDGVVPKEDLDRLEPDYLDSLNAGEEVPVYILNPNDRDGNLLVSINLGLQGHDWVRAHELLEAGEMVESEVSGFNRGGLLVRFGRLEGFVPASHVVGLDPGLPEPNRSEAMERLVGTTVGVKVIEVNQGRRRLILSQREAQRRWRDQQKQRLLETLNVGDVMSGRVTGIRDFGVFVDVGGADGLIHVSELAWHRVPHPRDVVTVGDEVEVYVLELDEENQRIALSLRRLRKDPWETVEEVYEKEQVVEGEVTNVVDFGAFVVLEDGIEGLLHVSEMADGTLTEPYSYVQRGDRLSVRIARIEASRRRIGFTQKGLELSGPTDVPQDNLDDAADAVNGDGEFPEPDEAGAVLPAEEVAEALETADDAEDELEDDASLEASEDASEQEADSDEEPPDSVPEGDEAEDEPEDNEDTPDDGSLEVSEDAPEQETGSDEVPPDSAPEDDEGESDS